MADLHLACQCGKVKGVAKKVSHRSGLHVRCFCDDCQAFAKYLEPSGALLDEYGGSEIYQQPLVAY